MIGELVDQGNKDTVSDWHTIWGIGYHAGREAAAVEHTIAEIRLEDQVEDCRTWLILSGVCLAAALIVAGSLIANGNIVITFVLQ